MVHVPGKAKVRGQTVMATDPPPDVHTWTGQSKGDDWLPNRGIGKIYRLTPSFVITA